MSEQYNYDPRQPLPPALRSVASEGASQGVNQALRMEQEAQKRAQQQGKEKSISDEEGAEGERGVQEGSPQPRTAGQLLEQLGMTGVDSSEWVRY
jgi:hypothetical protein